MNYQDILCEQIGAVLRVSHNRPSKRNAESENLLAELDDALARAARDDSVRVLYNRCAHKGTQGMPHGKDHHLS